MVSAFRSAVVLVSALCLLSSPALADGRAWPGFLDHGLGFARKYHEPGACGGQAGKMIDSLASISPNALGAAVGFAAGAAAGALLTGSISGALRAGFVGGSLGSAAAHFAEAAGVSEKMKEVAERLKGIINERETKLCALVEQGDRERTPVIERFARAIGPECHIPTDDITQLRLDAGLALKDCVRESPVARRIAERHAAMLRSINQNTCRAAALVVERYEQKLADQAAREGRQYEPEPDATSCEEPATESPVRAWTSSDSPARIEYL
ncbi:MAG: hypothetical protein ABW321_30510 [Polyangiales bacterium]